MIIYIYIFFFSFPYFLRCGSFSLTHPLLSGSSLCFALVVPVLITWNSSPRNLSSVTGLFPGRTAASCFWAYSRCFLQCFVLFICSYPQIAFLNSRDSWFGVLLPSLPSVTQLLLPFYFLQQICWELVSPIVGDMTRFNLLVFENSWGCLITHCCRFCAWGFGLTVLATFWCVCEVKDSRFKKLIERFYSRELQHRFALKKKKLWLHYGKLVQCIEGD